MSIAILIAYNTCPVSNFHQGYFNLIQVITPIDISRLLHTGAAFQVRRLFSSDVASAQNCQWFDIPLTLVHMSMVKYITECNWDRQIIAAYVAHLEWS